MHGTKSKASNHAPSLRNDLIPQTPQAICRPSTGGSGPLTMAVAIAATDFAFLHGPASVLPILEEGNSQSMGLPAKCVERPIRNMKLKMTSENHTGFIPSLWMWVTFLLLIESLKKKSS